MFTQSEQVNDLFAALSKAQGEFDHAKKDVKNDFYKSKYADLASCIDAAKDHLAKHGLLVTQPTYINETGETVLVTILGHSSGQWVKGEYPLRPVKVDPQGYGSALSYARRYCFCGITGIAADDDDGNAASNVNKPQQPDYAQKLKTAKSLDELADAWNGIPKQQQKAFFEAKELRKQQLALSSKQTKWKQLIKDAATAQELNAIWTSIPESERPDCQDDYEINLQKFKEKEG